MVSRRSNVPVPAPAFTAFIDSFTLALHAKDRKPRTRHNYVTAATWFAGWLSGKGVPNWYEVRPEHLRDFFIHLQELDYSKGYRNGVGRQLQAFFRWFAEEEGAPNPFDRIKPPPAPRLGDNPRPVLLVEQLGALIKAAEKGRDFASRRDAALLRFFASTGCRLAEVTGLARDDVSLKERTALVHGKGDKIRTVKFDYKCALALDRYINRARASHAGESLP
jgi:site-specific recombinase XerD